MPASRSSWRVIAIFLLPSTTSISSRVRLVIWRVRPASEYTGGHTSIIRREPIGVVASLAPWNYPFMMAAWKIGPALAAGNTVVLKPSVETPLTTLKLGEIALEAGLPAGVLNIITSGPGVAQALVQPSAGQHGFGHGQYRERQTYHAGRRRDHQTCTP